MLLYMYPAGSDCAVRFRLDQICTRSNIGEIDGDGVDASCFCLYCRKVGEVFAKKAPDGDCDRAGILYGDPHVCAVFGRVGDDLDAQGILPGLGLCVLLDLPRA